MPLWYSLFASADRAGSCSPVLMVSSFHHMVKRVALSSSSRFASSGDGGTLVGACVWCDVLQRCGMVPGSAPCGAPQNTSCLFKPLPPLLIMTEEAASCLWSVL